MSKYAFKVGQRVRARVRRVAHERGHGGQVWGGGGVSESRIRNLHNEDTCDLRCDGYTSQPTSVRIYREDHGDEFPWCIDGIDAQGHYTEAIWRFATHPEAVAALPDFIGIHMEWGGLDR